MKRYLIALMTLCLMVAFVVSPAALPMARAEPMVTTPIVRVMAAIAECQVCHQVFMKAVALDLIYHGTYAHYFGRHVGLHVLVSSLRIQVERTSLQQAIQQDGTYINYLMSGALNKTTRLDAMIRAMSAHPLCLAAYNKSTLESENIPPISIVIHPLCAVPVAYLIKANEMSLSFGHQEQRAAYNYLNVKNRRMAAMIQDNAITGENISTIKWLLDETNTVMSIALRMMEGAFIGVNTVVLRM